jgi:hypothetical protein
MKTWKTHTGSAPECQDTPKQIIKGWFGGNKILLGDARVCFDQLVEYYSDVDDDEDHRCFNRRDYELTFDDVKNIIRELKREENEI